MESVFIARRNEVFTNEGFINENLLASNESVWNTESVDRAVKEILQESNTLFDDLIKNENRQEIYFQIVKSNEKSFDTNCECLINEVIDKLKIGAPIISHHLKELSNSKTINRKRYINPNIKLNELLYKNMR